MTARRRRRARHDGKIVRRSPLETERPAAGVASTSRREPAQEAHRGGLPHGRSTHPRGPHPHRKLHRHRLLCEWWVTWREPVRRRPGPPVGGRRRGSHRDGQLEEPRNLSDGSKRHDLVHPRGRRSERVDLHGRVCHRAAAPHGRGRSAADRGSWGHREAPHPDASRRDNAGHLRRSAPVRLAGRPKEPDDTPVTSRPRGAQS